MTHEERDVPTSACRFAGGAVRFDTAEPDAAATPVRMLARTSQPIEHWYWGRVVHDMSGMQLHKDILPADYCHAEECGFLDTFEFDSSRNLIVSGKLVPTSAPDDIARKVIERSRGGVPYEASIDFSGDGIVVEEVSAGFSAPVNGYQFEGPGVIIRQWPLRGVAVCPYGADMNTKTSLAKSQAEQLRCKFVKAKTTSEVTEDNSMSEASAVVESEDVETKTVVTDGSANEEGEIVAANEEVAGAAPETPAAALSADRTEAARFHKAFGDKGAVWFAEGLTFDAARDREVKELREQVAELTKKLALRSEGEDSPVGFNSTDQKKRTGFASKYRIRTK